MKAPRWLVEIVIIVVAVLLIRATLVQAFNTPSASMQPTLLIGDFILVNKLVYRFSEPERGDIVVFKYPINPSLDYIKRVMGVPGDKIEFYEEFNERADMEVYGLKVNGKKLTLKFTGIVPSEGRFYHVFEEKVPRKGKEIKHRIWIRSSSYMVGATYVHSETMEAKICDRWEEYRGSSSGILVAFDEGGKTVIKRCTRFTVPEGYYFVMGDNRDNSEDSRFWGFVPQENIVGKAFVIYFSGRVPSLTPSDVNVFTGFKQLLIALLNPRPERIGLPLIH